MKKLLFFLSLGISTLFQTQAQQLENSLLWEISGNGLEKSSYLYGTIHMTCDATLDENITKALDDTTLLVLELDMDDPNMQMNMMKGIYMKDGNTLKDLVSEEDYELLTQFLKEQIGMSISMVGNIKPFFLTAMFYPKLLDCPVQSFENELMKVAHNQQEDVLGLETVEDQLNVFEAIPYVDQAKDLVRSAKDNLAYDKESFQQMLELYSNKNLEGLNELMINDKNLSTTKHKDKMLDDRNENWILKIEDFSRQQPTFFGVGAGHLPGEKGVINLLRKKGFTVQAVL